MEAHQTPDSPPSDPGPDLQKQVADKNTKRRSAHATPPYWQHNRTASYATVASSDRAPAITLQDNTDSQSLKHTQLWAKSITIDDYVIVKGSATGIGAYVVWICRVETLDGSPLTIRKRYSEFDELRNKLAVAFPQTSNTSLPPLPPKSAIYKFRKKFLEKRRQGLAYFLNCVMLDPQYATSDLVKDFIFSSTMDV